MSSNLQTSLIRFAIQQYPSPGKSQGIHVEVPASKFKSLRDISKWLNESGRPIVARALISIELPTSRLAEIFPPNPYLDYLALSVRDSIIALTDKLTEQSMDTHDDDEVQDLEFHVIEVDGRDVALPGMYVEVAHGHDIASDAEWWGDRLPGSVINHIAIEVYRDSLPLNIRSAIASRDHGEPEILEELIGTEILSVVNRLTMA